MNVIMYRRNLLHTAYGELTPWNYFANVKRLIKEQTFNAKLHKEFLSTTLASNEKTLKGNFLMHDLHSFYKFFNKPLALREKNINNLLKKRVIHLIYNLTKKDLVKHNAVNDYQLNPTATFHTKKINNFIVPKKAMLKRLME